MNTAPKQIIDALPDDLEERLNAHVSNDERICVAAKHHSPTPLLVHHVRLPDGRKVWICATCRDNLRVLHELGDHIEWSLLRRFGNRLRALLPQV